LKVRLPARLSTLLHHCFAPCKQLLLSWMAARHLHGPVPRPGIPLRSRAPAPQRSPTILVIRKERGALVDIGADLPWLQSRGGFSTAWRRLGVFVDLLSRPQVPDGAWAVDLGDSVSEDGSVLGFCSNRPDSLLVPDRGFHASRGYAQCRRQAASAPAFAERSDTIVWRGSATGYGAATNATMSPADADLRQRVRMCLLLRGDAGRALDVDAHIVPGRNATAEVADAYRRAEIAGGAIPESSWVGRKFAIDIDGHANAFSNLFIRLIYGCCVIKIASPLGYRQWYYDRLEPWRHYVPVAADMSDLVERIDWCRGHPDACRDIAAAGRTFALSLVPETEYRRTAAAIALRAS